LRRPPGCSATQRCRQNPPGRKPCTARADGLLPRLLQRPHPSILPVERRQLHMRAAFDHGGRRCSITRVILFCATLCSSAWIARSLAESSALVASSKIRIRRILEHIGVDSEPPQISLARGPPLWD
jgi:hypothetical protein